MGWVCFMHLLRFVTHYDTDNDVKKNKHLVVCSGCKLRFSRA